MLKKKGYNGRKIVPILKKLETAKPIKLDR